jgi:DNA helicase-2/ATP-dependent DNA helicase PcrA
LLVGQQNKLFVVGDDDQSIYGWRGARIENIQRFSSDFPGTQVLRLEQNYRSTATILSAANALIAYNNGRLGKKLWTDGGQGDPILMYAAFNETDEANFIVERIKRRLEEGQRRSECAVLYRSNAQSRVIEEALIMAGIPYRVYGGLRFFERAEIKDALAYMRLIRNRDDDASFERVVNTPVRGIGNRTLELVRDHARQTGTSLWQAAKALCDTPQSSARGVMALGGFFQLIEQLTQDTQDLELEEQTEHVINGSGLIEHYKKEKGEKGRARIENLEELVSAARQFEYDAEELEMDALSAFLSHAALEAGEGQGDTEQDCVQLMTLHSAKGLEFPLVFLCGMEEGLFPHQLSIEEPGRLEEERRLCYVGITRARQQLYMSYAECRRLYGSDSYQPPSRFIREIPEELVQEIRPAMRSVSAVQAPRPVARPIDDAPSGLRLGQQVSHAKFGEGVVLNYEGQGGHARVQVNFKNAGSKWLVVAYANLQTI